MSYQVPLKFVLPVFAALLVLLVAAWAFGLSPAAALTERDSEPIQLSAHPNAELTGLPYDVVQVSGQGTATGAPDLAQLRLSVEVTSATVAEAWNTAAETMQEVRDSLSANGIENKDVATRRIRINPDYEYGPEGRTQIGYIAENGLVVTIRDTDAVGTVLDAAVTAGGDHIRLDRFDFQFSDTDALEQEARQAAVENMQVKADQLANSSGRTLGDLKIVSEFPMPVGGRDSFAFAAFATDAAYDTTVSTGEGTVSVNVYGLYELR